MSDIARTGGLSRYEDRLAVRVRLQLRRQVQQRMAGPLRQDADEYFAATQKVDP